jgi:hypothetical protein
MDRKAKLDLNTSAGIFLGYTAMDKNVVIETVLQDDSKPPLMLYSTKLE